MEVILLERIEKLGKIGDRVRVKNGFARNFLLPNRKALRATKEAHEYFEQERAKFEEKNDAALAQAKINFDKINDKSWTLIRQASETGQLYGSVNSRDIVALLAEEECEISRSQVLVSVVIKALGIHEARVRLHPELIATIHLNVARSEEDAEGQRAALTAEEQAEKLEQAAAEIFEASNAAEKMAEELRTENAPTLESAETKTAEAPAPPAQEAAVGLDAAPADSPVDNGDNLEAPKPN